MKCSSLPHLAVVALALLPATTLIAQESPLELVQIAGNRSGFQLAGSRQPFVAWGFNYDHDEGGRLLEDYWHDEWPRIVEDFAEMKSLGANLVRVHLQLGRFMSAADTPNQHELAQLARLVELAEQTGVYLDVTGLGCYHKKDVPPWYDVLEEQDRWAVQAKFWGAVAKTCAASPAVFCYDLMNEPVVSAGPRRNDWLGPAFAGKHFVQFITLDLAGRDRTKIARQWISMLTSSIRQQDRRHLITVGLVPWSLERPGLSSGFIPAQIAGELDFIALHIYPESGRLDAADETIRGFVRAGKPVLIEETFPLKCSATELENTIEGAPDAVAGWLGFYWGQSEHQCRQAGTIPSAMMAGWLELFRRLAN